MTFVITVLVVIALGWAIITYGPIGLRTKIFHAVALVAPALAEVLQQIQVIDWSRIVDVPKVAYGLAVGIPIVGMWLRQVTGNDKPAGP